MKIFVMEDQCIYSTGSKLKNDLATRIKFLLNIKPLLSLSISRKNSPKVHLLSNQNWSETFGVTNNNSHHIGFYYVAN